jgi:hypothetical protein
MNEAYASFMQGWPQVGKYIASIYWWGRSLGSRDIAAILIVVVLAAAGLAVMGRFDWISLNWGFGPDWTCTHPGQGEPICIKEAPARSNDTGVDPP